MSKLRAAPEMARPTRPLAGAHCGGTCLHKGVRLPKGLVQSSPALGNRSPSIEIRNRGARHLSQNRQPLGLLYHISAWDLSGKLGQFQSNVSLVRIDGNADGGSQERPGGAPSLLQVSQSRSHQKRRLIHVT